MVAKAEVDKRTYREIGIYLEMYGRKFVRLNERIMFIRSQIVRFNERIIR